LRKGPWKLLPPDKGARARGKQLKPEVEHPAEAVAKKDYPPEKVKLFTLTDDLSETKDIATAHPDIVAEMSAKLAEIMKSGK